MYVPRDNGIPHDVVSQRHSVEQIACDVHIATCGERPHHRRDADHIRARDLCERGVRADGVAERDVHGDDPSLDVRVRGGVVPAHRDQRPLPCTRIAACGPLTGRDRGRRQGGGCVDEEAEGVVVGRERAPGERVEEGIVGVQRGGAPREDEARIGEVARGCERGEEGGEVVEGEASDTRRCVWSAHGRRGWWGATTVSREGNGSIPAGDRQNIFFRREEKLPVLIPINASGLG
jgi:hypothetical protein